METYPFQTSAPYEQQSTLTPEERARRNQHIKEALAGLLFVGSVFAIGYAAGRASK